MLVGQTQTEGIFRYILHSLKQKFMINPLQSWIIGVDGCLSLFNILYLFDEGDKVLVVGANITEFQTCQAHQVFQEFKIWSLHSSGNGSTKFHEIGFWNTFNSSVHFDEPLFDPTFTNFGGRVLRISSLGSPPVKEPPLPGEHKWRGYIFHIVNMLGDLYNFTYVVKEADNRLYGMIQEDGTWSGMMGELANKSVDMGVGDLSWTFDRDMAADLTYPVYPETSTFIYRAPAFYSRTWILFQDIEFRIWISLSSIMITACYVYCLTLCVTEVCENERKWNLNEGNTFVRAAVRSVGSLYRALLGQGIVYKPRSVSCRTVLGTWFMGSLILSSLYGGSLTSTLSLHRTPRPAESLKSLMKRYPNAILALRNNSQIHSYFMDSDYWHELWLKNIQKNVIPGNHRIADIMEEVHRKESPIYVWIAERSMLVKQMHRYSDDSSVCDLYVAKEDVIRSDWSLGLVRNSPFLQQFNEKIIRLQRFGLLQKWHTDHWKSGKGECRPTDGRNPTGLTPISIADTQASFFVLSLGWIAGFFILLAERRMHKKVARRTD